MKLICKFKGCQWGAIEWATNYPPLSSAARLVWQLWQWLCQCQWQQCLPYARTLIICQRFDSAIRATSPTTIVPSLPPPQPPLTTAVGHVGNAVPCCTRSPYRQPTLPTLCLPEVMSLHALQFWFNLLPVPRQLPTLAKIAHWIDNNLKFNCLLLLLLKLTFKTRAIEMS